LYLQFNPEVGKIRSNGVHRPVYLNLSCSKNVYINNYINEKILLY